MNTLFDTLVILSGVIVFTSFAMFGIGYTLLGMCISLGVAVYLVNN